jgi:predicted nucleotidyltransferase
MITLDEIITVIQWNNDKLKAFGVRKLGVFGSFARGEAPTESDIDFLVILEPKTFDGYMELKFFLEDLFNCGVDLVLIDAIKPALRENIENEVVYATGI